MKVFLHSFMSNLFNNQSAGLNAENPFEIFNFEGKNVRTQMQDDEVLFCAKDVCEVLEITWSQSTTLNTIPSEWCLTLETQGSGQKRRAIFLNQQAVYKLAFRSNKPNADKFTTYVCEILKKLSEGKAVQFGIDNKCAEIKTKIAGKPGSKFYFNSEDYNNLLKTIKQAGEIVDEITAENCLDKLVNNAIHAGAMYRVADENINPLIKIDNILTKVAQVSKLIKVDLAQYGLGNGSGNGKGSSQIETPVKSKSKSITHPSDFGNFLMEQARMAV